jgi:hypothetical protein
MLNPQASMLENAFFHKRDAELLAILRRREAEMDKKKALAIVSGITDGGILTQLVAHDISAETLVPFSMIPVLEVVWADGEVQAAERVVIINALKESGVREDGPAFEMLDRWLQQPPEPKLLPLWKQYTQALMQELTPEAREGVKQTVLKHARDVAQAAGGFLGFGRITDKEMEMLEQLEQAFKI